MLVAYYLYSICPSLPLSPTKFVRLPQAIQKYIEVRNIQVNAILGNYADTPLSLTAALDLLTGSISSNFRRMIVEDMHIFEDCMFTEVPLGLPQP